MMMITGPSPREVRRPFRARPPPARTWSSELEFVQLLAQPSFLQFLAGEGLLQQPSFVTYLQALLATWRQPAYSCHLAWPACLTILELLAEDADFRVAAPRMAPAVLAQLTAAASAAGGPI